MNSIGLGIGLGIGGVAASGILRPNLVTTYTYADDFYGFGDVSISGRIPPVRPIASSATWTVVNSFVLAGGHGEARFGSAGTDLIFFDLNIQDATARIEFEFPANKGTASVMLRYLDTSNYWLAQMDFNNLNFKINSQIAGVFTNRVTSTFTTMAADTRYAIVFAVSGDIFTATYYQVINGVDTQITPTSGTNPQTFDATAVGSGTGRTKHGIRASSTVGLAPVRFYKFEGDPSPLPEDDTVTVAGSSTVTSRTVPAVSFVENPTVWNTSGWTAMKPNINSSVGALKIHIFPFGLLDPWASNSSGPTESNPSLWNTSNTRLTQALVKLREINASVPIILTLYGGTWWMKQTVFANTIANLTSASAYDDAGRIKASQLANWLIMVDEAVQIAAAQGCRDFEVWNELKGYYDVYPTVGQTWDASMGHGDGSGGANDLVMGYSYFYQQTANRVVSTMTALGFARNTYRIGGPYMLMNSQGTADSDSIGPAEPLYAYRNIWGYQDKEGIGALKQFLGFAQANSFPLDTLLIDATTWNTDEHYPTADPFDLTRKYADQIAYIRSILPTYGFSADMPIDYSEIYAMPQPALRTTGSAELITAMTADMLVGCLLNRVRYPVLWGPTAAGTGGTGGSNMGIVTTAGALQGPGSVCGFVKSNFAPGTALYVCTSANGLLGAIATATKIIVYNKTSNPLIARVDGDLLSFTAYETKMLTR